MSGLDLSRAADALIRLGEPGPHPAGAVVGVRAGGQVSVAAAGAAVATTGGLTEIGMSPSTVLDLASVTKVASSTALAMRLVAAGRLDLDVPVREYLPAFSGDGREAVEVHHLLEHTSGLAPWIPLYCTTTVREEALQIVARMPLTDVPGARWTYSDLGMMLLGAVLEQVTGRRQDRAYADLVAGPLGLRATGYGPVGPDGVAASSDGDAIEHEMVRSGKPYPTPFTTGDFEGWRDAPTIGVPNDGNAAHALDGVAGHAGLFAPADELLRLGAWLTDPQAHRADVLARFTAPLQTAANRALGFRLATLEVGRDRVPCVAHPGFTGVTLLSALDRDLSVVVAATRLHTATGTPSHPRAPAARLVSVEAITRTGLGEVVSELVRREALPAARDDAPLATPAPTIPTRSTR